MAEVSRDIQSVKEFASILLYMGGPWRKPLATFMELIQKRDAAIRQRVAGEVLDRVDAAVIDASHLAHVSMEVEKLRREYAQEKKTMEQTRYSVGVDIASKGGDFSATVYAFTDEQLAAHDAEVARGAKVGLLQEMGRLVRDRGLMWPTATMLELASRYGIATEELVERKKWTGADVKVDSARGTGWSRILCGPNMWTGEYWEEPSAYFKHSKHDAEAIAAHLREHGPLPEEGK